MLLETNLLLLLLLDHYTVKYFKDFFSLKFIKQRTKIRTDKGPKKDEKEPKEDQKRTREGPKKGLKKDQKRKKSEQKK